jgi:hypothetical protein
MSIPRVRDIQPVASEVVAGAAASRAPESGGAVDDIVERALAILDEESHEWMQGQPSRNARSGRVHAGPGNLS